MLPIDLKLHDHTRPPLMLAIPFFLSAYSMDAAGTVACHVPVCQCMYTQTPPPISMQNNLCQELSKSVCVSLDAAVRFYAAERRNAISVLFYWQKELWQ